MLITSTISVTVEQFTSISPHGHCGGLLAVYPRNATFIADIGDVGGAATTEIGVARAVARERGTAHREAHVVIVDEWETG